MASVGLTVFTLYMGFHITLGPIVTRAAHLMVVIPLGFFSIRPGSGFPTVGPRRSTIFWLPLLAPL